MPRSVKWKTIEIPAPVANIGDRVLVANYRAAGSPWEPGTLERAEYHLHYKSWSYSVRLDRTGGRRGNRMWRYVADDGLQSLDEVGG